jgi:hypothetical protein
LPGSFFDSTVFEESHVFKNKNDCFSVGEFLLADGARVVLFSSARVVLEHVNDILKARWSSLRGLRTQISKQLDTYLLSFT